jgi:hypothetical protein
MPRLGTCDPNYKLRNYVIASQKPSIFADHLKPMKLADVNRCIDTGLPTADDHFIFAVRKIIRNEAVKAVLIFASNTRLRPG